MAVASWSELLFANAADHTALSAFTSEASLIAGPNLQPYIEAGMFARNESKGRSLLITASGVLTTGATPTYTWQFRISTTQGSSTLSGTLIGQTAAITTQNAVSAKAWEAYLRITCNTPGMGTGLCTISCDGFIKSPQGFASPYEYAISLGTPPSATWTATMDGALRQYINFSVTSSSDASNACTCKRLWVQLLN